MRRSGATPRSIMCAVYLLSDLGASTTGDVIFVDGGYHAIGLAQLENLERPS